MSGKGRLFDDNGFSVHGKHDNHLDSGMRYMKELLFPCIFSHCQNSNYTAYALEVPSPLICIFMRKNSKIPGLDFFNVFSFIWDFSWIRLNVVDFLISISGC